MEVRRRFYKQNPRKLFSRINVRPTNNELPGEKRPIDIFQLFIGDEMLERIAPWTNEWFQVKKAAEPNKHKAPFDPITDIAELKAYICVLLAVNQNIDLPRYEHYFCQDESKWLLLHLDSTRYSLGRDFTAEQVHFFVIRML